MGMKSRLWAVVAFVALVMVGMSLRWRYDEVTTGPYGRKLLVRTCRFTGQLQRFSEYGWLPEKNAVSTLPAASPPPAGESPDPYAEAFAGLPAKR